MPELRLNERLQLSTALLAGTMKSRYPGYFRPNAHALTTLVDNAHFLYDANVLLNLYRYSTETRDEILAVVRALSTRNYLTYQAGLEFHRNRVGAIQDHADGFASMRTTLTRVRKEMTELYRAPSKPTPSEQEDIDSAWVVLDDFLAESIDHAIKPSLNLEDDPIWESVSELFEGRVGAKPTPDAVKKLIQEGRERLASRTPPGYRDEKKPEPDRYGDWLMWSEVLEHAAEHKVPVVFVTDEEKDDWWLSARGQVLGPRPELVEEMRDRSGQDFYMYRPAQFLEIVGASVEEQPTANVIEEVRKLEPRERSTAREIAGVASPAEFQSLERRRSSLYGILHEIDLELGSQSGNTDRTRLEARRQRVQEELARVDAQLLDLLPAWARGSAVVATSSNSDPWRTYYMYDSQPFNYEQTIQLGETQISTVNTTYAVDSFGGSLPEATLVAATPTRTKRAKLPSRSPKKASENHK